MLNLLRSDLYRITRPRRLRGMLWHYLIMLAVCVAIETLTSWMLIEQGLGSPEQLRMGRTPSAFFASWMLSSPSITMLACTFGALEFLFADLTSGYAKTLIASLRGRLALFAEKVLFAGVWSLIVIAAHLILTAGMLLFFMTQGSEYVFHEADAVASLVFWALGLWLTSWALSVIPFFFALATRAKIPSYIFSGLTLVSAFPIFLMGLTASSGSMMRFLDPLAPLFTALANWMPSIALASLSTGAGHMLSPTPDTLLGIPLPNVATWIMLIGVIWIAAASALYLIIARRKDA